MNSVNRLRPRAFEAPEPCPVVSEPEQLRADYPDYGKDESKLPAASPASLAFPATLGQLAQVMARHHTARHSVLVSGARTGVVGGAVASPGVHIVSTERLSGVVSVGQDATGEAFVRVRAGTPLAALNEHLSAHHPALVFPVDPTETSASIGGMVATNASGTRSFRYGSTRRWVRALQVVLVDGRVLALRRGEVKAEDGVLWLDDDHAARRLEGAPIPKPRTKHAIGYSYAREVDAIDLFVGAEGTLGLVAEVELGLARRPRSSLFYLQFFPTAEGAFDFVDWLRADDALQPAAIEYFDQRSLELLVKRVPQSRSRFVGLIGADCGAAIYAELELQHEDELEAALQRIGEAVEGAGASLDSSVAGTDDADWRALKQFRHAVPEQINAIIAQRKRAVPGLHKVSTDMAVDDAHLRAIHQYYRDTLQQHGLEHFIFGHVGNNHLHVNITPRDASELELAMSLYREIAVEVCRLGGSVAAEHGIGRLKRGLLSLQYDPAQLETMRRIKRFFDPDGRLNPGVLLESASALA